MNKSVRVNVIWISAFHLPKCQRRESGNHYRDRVMRPLLFQTNLIPGVCYKGLNIKMHKVWRNLSVCVCVCDSLLIIFCMSKWDSSGKTTYEDRRDQNCACFIYWMWKLLAEFPQLFPAFL